MKIWLSKNSEVSVREQIIAQIVLGITSGDLSVGEKLPSTQEISRRYKIHPNTVSNAYQKLADDGWIEFRKGSGFYVCKTENENSEDKISLDSLIAEFTKTAQLKGFSKSEIKDRFEKWFTNETSKEIFLVESDKDLREILIEEIREAVNCEVSGISFEEFQVEHEKINAYFTAMSDEESKIQSVISANKECFYLKSRSVSASMTGETRPKSEDLIAVVSGWEQFLILAKTILIAADVESESILLRSVNEENWQNGLKNASMIICDFLTAKKISYKEKVRPFRLISDESLKEIQFLTR